MAETETAKAPKPQTRVVVGFDVGESSSGRSAPHSSQKDRRKDPPQAPQASASQPRPSATSAWKAMASTPIRPGAEGNMSATSSGPGVRPPAQGTHSSPAIRAAAVSDVRATTTPVKAPPMRRVSRYVLRFSRGLANAKSDRKSDKRAPAWATPSPQSLQPVSTSSSSPAPSFADIQQQEQERSIAIPQNKRSLREIQQEQEQNQAEEEFLKWWNAEEARLKTVDRAIPASQGPKAGHRKNRGPKARPPSD